jgi:tRNA pseudouridine38-40 synthase
MSEMTKNIRLLLAYDGTHFAGWQVQPERPTIQGALELAIRKLTGKAVRVLSAGRTDAGVHALGQVANFHSSFPIPPHKWRPALQSELPEDIVILQSDEVPADFHATFSARSKRYRYIIYNHLVDNPFLRRYSWRISQELNDAAMHVAAQSLVGTHDFRSFESDWPNKASSVRTVTEISVRRYGGWEALAPQSIAEQTRQDHVSPHDFICLEIEANGFLYNMVRAITGTLVNVGRGTWTDEDVVRVLKAQDRSVGGGTAPAEGLFLVRVNYGEELGFRIQRSEDAANRLP